jgi:hypothetical protein
LAPSSFVVPPSPWRERKGALALRTRSGMPIPGRVLRYGADGVEWRRTRTRTRLIPLEEEGCNPRTYTHTVLRASGIRYRALSSGLYLSSYGVHRLVVTAYRQLVPAVRGAEGRGTKYTSPLCTGSAMYRHERQERSQRERAGELVLQLEGRWRLLRTVCLCPTEAWMRGRAKAASPRLALSCFSDKQQQGMAWHGWLYRQYCIP